MLLMELGCGVHVSGVGRLALGGGHGRQGSTALQAGRIPATAIEVVVRAGAGFLVAVHVTAICALSVDHHAACNDKPAGETRCVQSREQRRSAQVVVAHVVGDVREVLPETHHCRLMRDRIAAAHEELERPYIAYIDLVVSRGFIQVGGLVGMRLWQQDVDDQHLMTVLHERVDNVGADEAGPPGYENPHEVSTRIGNRTVNAQPPLSLCTLMSP